MAAAPLLIGVISAVSTIGEAYATKQAADFNAEKVQQEAKIDMEQERQRLRQIQGAAEAAAGASGIQMGGSAASLMESNAITSEQNRLMIQYGAKQQASIMKAEGRNAMTSGIIRAGTSLLQGVSNSYAGKSSSETTTQKNITEYDTTPTPQFKPQQRGY